MLHPNSRRSFLRKSLAFSSISLFAKTELYAHNQETGDNFTFLFQGDSITDGNRTRNNDWNHVMGHGYACDVASKLWYKFPEKQFHFFNRGISANKITDLENRWDTDTLALKPDLLSILVGINDVDTFINGNQDFTPAFFEDRYRALLQKTKEALPNIQLVLCEPFIFPVGKVKDKFEIYTTEIKKRQEIVLKLAKEFDAIHIPYQSIFDKALERATADYWIWDGIHPMPVGHEMMALEWINLVGKKLKFIR